MGDEASGESGKMMRPNDLFTAAFYGDVKKLKELLFIEPVEEDPPMEEEFDPMAAPDEEAEEAARDRDARRKANDDELQKRLSATGRIVTRLSPVNKQFFGIGLLVGERDGKPTIQFKPSKSAAAEGTALHWAVLGCEHEAVEYLLLMGANPAAKVTELDVTVDDILTKNDLRETRKAVERGMAARQAKADAVQGKKDARAAELAKRARARDDAIADQKRKEDEERMAEEAEARAAEDAAAAEAAGGAPEDGGEEGDE
jgi:hypothetical protein